MLSQETNLHDTWYEHTMVLRISPDVGQLQKGHKAVNI